MLDTVIPAHVALFRLVSWKYLPIPDRDSGNTSTVCSLSYKSCPDSILSASPPRKCSLPFEPSSFNFLKSDNIGNLSFIMRLAQKWSSYMWQLRLVCLIQLIDTLLIETRSETDLLFVTQLQQTSVSPLPD
eukprot:Filipodium_phascolosomae@DN2748_c4_g1_i26.p1